MKHELSRPAIHLAHRYWQLTARDPALQNPVKSKLHAQETPKIAAAAPVRQHLANRDNRDSKHLTPLHGQLMRAV